MASTTSTIRVGETGPPRHRAFVLRRARVAVTVAAVAALAVVGAPTTGATTPITTRVLLSIIDTGRTPVQVADTVQRAGGQVVARYDVADALLVELPLGAALPTGTTAVADVALHVTSLTPSATVAADIKGATYRTTIDAPDSGRGAGVTVAVVDTGVDEVTDLAGRLTHVNVSGGPDGDGLGHGTFMAGLIAGDGTASDGTYTGVAPDARVLDVQVATADGTTSLSRVLSGLQAVADRARTDRSLRVVSLALSTGSPLPPSSDPLARALDQLWARGLTVVVSAGNDGPDKATVTSPGADPTLITVGSLDEHGTSVRGDDTVSTFSSRGTPFGTQKPDLVAPGASVVSTRAAGSQADAENPASRVLQDYFTGSGTSMSEAITAGAAAVLVSSRSALTPATVKRLLTTTAYQTDTLEKRDGAGAGGLDLGAAVAKAATVRIVGTARSDVDLVDDGYGPDPADAATWQQFQQAWAAGDLDAVSAAWVQLSPQSRKWAANAFSLALIGANASANDRDFAAIESMAHAWATQRWNDRNWASDGWVAHAWTGDDWAAHAWTLSDWSAHAWRDSSWSAHAWTEVYWDAHAWTAHAWTAHAWTAHAWTDNDWLAFAWTARDWAAHAWAAEAWQAQSFSAHAWTGDTWSAHAWAQDTWSAHAWTAHAWTAHAWTAHAWTAGDWQGYVWAAHAWAAQAWTADVWASVDLTRPTE